jgi:hypothetical protein
MGRHRLLVFSVLLCAATALAGCGRVVSSVTSGVADGLAQGILNQDDLQLVADGVPTYLLMLDGLIESNPSNPHTLLAAAKLYGAYGGTFVTDPDRAKRLTAKARDYAARGACISDKSLCELDKIPFAVFEQRLSAAKSGSTAALYTLATAWTGWIQTHSADWNAVADIAKVKALLMAVRERDPAYDNGGVSLYLGALATILPPALGGKPDEGKAFFEQAIADSDGKNLMAKVLYAERYARLVFDRDLHDNLLTDVLAAETKHPGLTLMNTLARQKATDLLASAEDYF